MDTIDRTTLHDAADVLLGQGMDIIHTVTVTLNGQHGGVDVILEGYEDDTHLTPMSWIVQINSSGSVTNREKLLQ